MKKLKYFTKHKTEFNGFLKNQDKLGESGKKIIIAAATAIFTISLTFSLAPRKTYVNPGISPSYSYVVAHAGGALENDGKTLKYLNSVEGFQKYYADGTRMFEYDLVFSKEGKLVATHKFEYFDGYSMKNPIPYETYTQTKIAGKFEGMTEDKLFEVIEENPDCKFIIDTKEKNETNVYERIVELAKEKEVDISKSILPFVTSKEMLENINKMYDFEEIMLTNYKKNYTTRELLHIIDSCDKIKYLHIFPVDFIDIDINEINKKGIRVFAHMDKRNKARTALDYGCTGIFSDDISENEFKEKHYDFMVSKLETVKEIPLPRKQEKHSIETELSF